MNKTINAYANIFGPIGYAHHARKFFLALNKLIPVCLVPKFGQLPEEADSPEFGDMLHRIFDIDLKSVAINLDYPEEMMRFTGGYKIAYTVFETEVLSEVAIHQLKQMDSVWVPSHWAADVLKKNGLDSQKINVVPEGVDCSTFKAGVEPYSELNQLKGFKFLSVGKWESRKGIKELIMSFDQTFKPEDEVFLVLYYPNHVSALSQINVNEEVNKLHLKNRSKVIVIDTQLPKEEDMARLYASCQAYVSASKAEGWGLPITEAMASGLCTIAPFYSAPTEYLTENNAVCLPVTEKEEVFCPQFFPNKGEYGTWAKINTQLLSEKLRWVFEHQEQARAIGVRAAQDMNDFWTWDHAAQKAAEILKAI